MRAIARPLVVAGVWMLVGASAANAATWRNLPVPHNSRMALEVSRTVPGLVWSIYGREPLVSRDGGTSWSPSGGVEGPLVEDAAPGRLWRVTLGGLQRSDDGGGTWQLVPGLDEALLGQLADFKQLLADPARSGVLYAITGSGPPDSNGYEGVLESQDGGATWVPWKISLHVQELTEWGFRDTWSALPGRDALLLVRAGGIESDVAQEVAIAGPDGLSPLQSKTGRRGGGNENNGVILGLTLTGRAVVDASGRRVLLESTHGWQLSTDGGAHFQVLQPRIPEGGAQPAFDPQDAHRIYAVHGSVLVRSDDDGAHWRTLHAGLQGADQLLVGTGGEIFATGAAGDASSRDGGRTLAYQRSPGVPISIESLEGDGRGGLLAATERGVWRIGAGWVWRPAEHAVLPLPAILAAPLGRTPGVLVVRPEFPDVAEPWVHLGEQLQALTEHGAARALGLPGRTGFIRTAFASDSGAQHIVLGSDWTATGGARWHLTAGRDASVASSGVVYGTRDDQHANGRSTLWRRSGVLPWRRVARFAGESCSPRAAGPERVYVLCADRVLRSDDGGRTLRRLRLPLRLPPGSLTSLAADQRRPDHVAVLVSDDVTCGGSPGRAVTLTSTDAGASWRSTADACGSDPFRQLVIAPDGDLLRWSSLPGPSALQLLVGWR